MTTQLQRWQQTFEDSLLYDNVRKAFTSFARPAELIQSYERKNLRADLIAGTTVAVILLPQAIAYALVAELPASMGLYTAIVAAIVGALWGSSNHLHTGPTNTASLLVLTVLLPVADPGTPRFIAAAGLLAVMVGIFRLLMGLARLGMLVNFVSDSVIVGFTAGAGVLIAANQLRVLFRLDVPATPSLVETLYHTARALPDLHTLTFALGLGTIFLIVALQHLRSNWPAALLAMIAATGAVGLLGLDRQGVDVLGELPRHLPPLARLPLLDLQLIGELSTGALAVSAIGLVEAMSIARAISAQSGQRLASNQEFVGQGLANIAAGVFSGYPCAGSFTRSVVNYKAGARTPLSAVFSASLVLLAVFLLAPFAAFVPRTALAGVLVVTAYGMIDWPEMRRIWHGTRADALIMIVTLIATLLLPLQFAVLTGILMSLAHYVLETSTPRVRTVLPDENFRHLVPRPDQRECPQLGLIDILGDLYFGASGHVEDAIHRHMTEHPEQRFLLLRMQGVQHCDISGIHVLESIVRKYRERDGDVFLVGVREPVRNFMKSTNFYRFLGEENFLNMDNALSHIFYRILDPAICIYECNIRAFRECQNLPKRDYSVDVPRKPPAPTNDVETIDPEELWITLRGKTPPLVIDVREPREFKRGHIPRATLIPFPKLFSELDSLPREREVVLVCRTGRRSTRAAQLLRERGLDNVSVLTGGIRGWESADLLEAVERFEGEQR